MAKEASRIEHVCACCGLSTRFESTRTLQRTDQLFQDSVQSNFFAEAELDCCGQDGDNYKFCKTCFNSISKSNRPKLGCKNGVNTTCCQSYPKELEDLSPVEEAVIARAHPVISILKLRPVGVSTSVTYQRIRGHAVVLPQNPGPLLNSLPSASLRLHDVIRIVWASERAHTAADIRSFASIRREKVLTALRWLKSENPLYRDIVINFNLLDE